MSELQLTRCPICQEPNPEDTDQCSHCGADLTAAGKGSRNRTLKVLLIALVLGAGVCLITLVCGLGGYYLFKEEIRERLSSKNTPFESTSGFNLQVDSQGEGLRGTYQELEDQSGPAIEFEVSPEGRAVIQTSLADPKNKLTVDLQDRENAVLEWNGVILDGQGPLTPGERDALEDLASSEVGQALGMIALEGSCGRDPQEDAREIAALVFPLQMQFKYLINERTEAARELIASTSCLGNSASGSQTSSQTPVLLSPSMPVPVVPGYFPFDPEGAVEPAASLEPGAGLACLTSPLGSGSSSNRTNPSAGSSQDAEEIVINEYGPCEATCRGACGADCEPNNCTKTTEKRCLEGKDGVLTGYYEEVTSYECGMHQGCIEHDDCYDSCNQRLGCDTWAAAHCRHSWEGNLTNFLFSDSNCDQQAIALEGFGNPILWMYGYGPQPIRKTFQYIDPIQKYDSAACPQVFPEETKEESIGIKDLSWELDSVSVNPDNAQSAFFGGGQDPYWFPEQRFEGKSLVYGYSETSFSVHDREVDHGYEYHDVTITVNFEAPPEKLDPGEEVILAVTASHAGTVNEGGSGTVIQFQYRSEDVAVSPDSVFQYAPWADWFDGSSSAGFQFTAPNPDAGAEFSLEATLWNASPATVVWIYRAVEVD